MYEVNSGKNLLRLVNEKMQLVEDGRRAETAESGASATLRINNGTVVGRDKDGT